MKLALIPLETMMLQILVEKDNVALERLSYFIDKIAQELKGLLLNVCVRPTRDLCL